MRFVLHCLDSDDADERKAGEEYLTEYPDVGLTASKLICCLVVAPFVWNY